MTKTPNPVDVYAGSKLRLQRQIRQMSQTDLANALGITFQQVQKYEKGTNRISASRLQAICGILGVPISFFFKDSAEDPLSLEGVGSPDGGMTQFLATTDGVKLNRAFIAIKDEKIRRSVVALVKALARAGDAPEIEFDIAEKHSPMHLQ